MKKIMLAAVVAGFTGMAFGQNPDASAASLNLSDRAITKQESSDIGRWYMGVAPGFMLFERDMNMKRRTGYGAFRLGYDYSDRYSFEFGGLIAPMIVDNPRHAKHGRNRNAEGQYAWDGTGQIYGMYVDALMHYDKYAQFDPYLLVGAGAYGSNERVFGDEHVAFVPRLGVGAMYHFTDKLSLRFDAIAQCFVNDNTEFGGGFELGLVYRFGGGSGERVSVGEGLAVVPGVDSDGDGLTDEEEIALGTNPYNKDTDGDGLTDFEEVRTYKTNPLLPDTDFDGLTDFEEVKTYKTDPLKADTDGGGVSDGHEVLIDKTDPLDPADDLVKYEFNLNFGYDVAVIDPKYYASLDEVVKLLNDNPLATALIEGHTDRKKASSKSYNQKLSERRATAVADYFVKKGIASKRLSTKGYGFTSPKVQPDLVNGNPENRRVEVYVRGVTVNRPNIKR